MQQVKRFLLLAVEIATPIVTFLISFVLSLLVANYFGLNQIWLLPILIFPVSASTAGLFAMRRRTRRWKIAYDAAGWTLSQAERKHPARAKCKRIAKRILVWAPSTIAAGVLFFLPVATHVVHPRAGHLKYYRVPIPWTLAVFSSPDPTAQSGRVEAFAMGDRGRFGLPPFWRTGVLSSVMLFGSRSPDADTFAFNHKAAESRRQGAAEELRRAFRVDDITLTCWQYRFPDRIGSSDADLPLWVISCETPEDARERNLYSSFYGREKDIPAFYRIIQGVKTVR